MKLINIKLIDYRSFANADVQLDGKTTIFFGVNGTGKSSILHAINLMYAPVLNKIVEVNKYQQSVSFVPEDIRYGCRQTSIDIDMKIDDELFDLHRAYRNLKGDHSTNSKDLSKIVEKFHEYYLNDDGHIPIYVYYGTNRLVNDIPLRIRNKHDFFEINSTYEHAIQPQLDFRTFFEWFRNQEDFQNEEAMRRKDFDYKDPALSAVKTAVEAMLGDCEDLRVERKPHLAMKVNKNGIPLNVSQLSDGEKCTMAMFGDLARRLSLANPKSENPLFGEGIVLIDELELHMHPSWQRVILSKLRTTFPNVQFILTTHSPVVLSEIDDNCNLFSMITKNGLTLVEKEKNLDGYDINTILNSFMNTSSQSETSMKIRKDLFESLEIGKRDEILRNIDRLSNLTDSNDPDVIRANMIFLRKEKNGEIY